MSHHRRRGARVLGAVAVGVLLVSGCQASAGPGSEDDASAPSGPRPAERTAASGPTLTLAFAGDLHFEGGLAPRPSREGSTVGPMSRALRSADLAVVNLEGAVTRREVRARKELEDPAQRYWFRSPPAALGVLARSGIDVASVANNHGADYGAAGLRDTLRAARGSDVALVGAGRDVEEAFAPHRVRIKGTDVAVLAADASPLESAAPVWSARPGSGVGLAAARGPEGSRLVAAVGDAARTDDLVVVYLHWGEEGNACPTGLQQSLARSLAEAGADVVVGSHAHVSLGAGMLEETYVSYGLGNFLWYHGQQSETGVLRLRVRDGVVVGDDWRAARIPPAGGAPRPLTGADRADAVADWRRLRACTDLAPGPSAAPPRSQASGDGDAGGERMPAFTSTVRPIGPALRRSMRSSHDPASCPVPLTDLRHLTLAYVGFDGRAHEGELVVHVEVASDVAGVFAALYRERFPIRRMVLVDAYGGNDERSMAANNTSAYNCRRVAGSTSFSDHAYGRAIDLNPLQNPYVRGERVSPPSGRRFVDVDRSRTARPAPGVIVAGDVVSRSFDRLGWTWGGDFADPDFQHFSAP